jgi:tetratricopeptide (TPR) repeat protein
MRISMPTVFAGPSLLLVLFLATLPGGARCEEVNAIYDHAVNLFTKRDLAGARREFLRIVELAPPALHSRYYLGRIALLEAKPAEAVRWLEPAADAEPPVFDAASQLTKAYVQTGQLDKASASIERALRVTPWDGSLHYRLARIQQQLGQQDLASKEFAASVKYKAKDRVSVESLLECSNLIAKRDLDGALRIRNQLVANDSLDPDVLVALGLVFANAGLQSQALEPFETAAKRDPNLFQAQFNAGLAFLKLERPADSILPLQASIRLLPDSGDALAALSVAYVLQGRYRDSIPILEHWRELQPENPRLLTTLSLAYLRTGKPEQAVPLLHEVVAHSSTDPKPYFLLIEALNALEKQDQAIPVCDDVARLFPDLAQAHLARAQQLARLGRYSDAGPEFRRTLELTPGSVDALLGLGEVQQKAGDYQPSFETYRQSLNLDPGNRAATLGAARDLIFLNRYAEARELLESAVKRDEADPQLHFELSRVYARLGERELAAAELRIVDKIRAGENKTR